MSASALPPDPRRTAPRVGAEFKVRYQRLEQFLEEYTTDLSRGGMFLATTNYQPNNTIIQCVLHLPGGHGEVRVIGRVAHVLDEATAKACGRRAGMGIEFLDVPREDADRLAGYLARVTGADRRARWRRRRRRRWASRAAGACVR